jgi:hypothetical protein
MVIKILQLLRCNIHLMNPFLVLTHSAHIQAQRVSKLYTYTHIHTYIQNTFWMRTQHVFWPREFEGLKDVKRDA